MIEEPGEEERGGEGEDGGGTGEDGRKRMKGGTWPGRHRGMKGEGSRRRREEEEREGQEEEQRERRGGTARREGPGP